MVGKTLYKIDKSCVLNSKSFESLIKFYLPLIGNDALAVFQYMYVKGEKIGFEELNDILLFLNISIDTFEQALNKLNDYSLVKTFCSEDEKYIFKIMDPLYPEEFVKNDVLVRNFILNVGGEKYLELISDYRMPADRYKDFKDVSHHLSAAVLDRWSENDETFLKNRNNKEYLFNTMFDVNIFLKDVSLNLLPMRFRTFENLKEIATLADLYNVSYDKMRSYLPKVARSNEEDIDLDLLKYMCMNSKAEYKTNPSDSYDVPCLSFLMSLQDGKDVSPYDRKIIYNLSHDYSLRPAVINVLLKYVLENNDNRLTANFIYALASDLHRNNVQTSSAALERLKVKPKKTLEKDVLPVYDSTNNPTLDKEKLREILKERTKQ